MVAPGYLLLIQLLLSLIEPLLKFSPYLFVRIAFIFAVPNVFKFHPKNCHRDRCSGFERGHRRTLMRIAPYLLF